MQKRFLTYDFDRISPIDPNTKNGLLQEFMPQFRYKKKMTVPLHEYGHGPFCKFSIPKDYDDSGVYILTVNHQPYYVGACANLQRVFNTGFGRISPSSCYEGGQPTFCRINTLILKTIRDGKQVDLWFYTTNDSANAVKSALIAEFNTENHWNLTG